MFVFSITSVFAQGKGNKKSLTPEQRATNQSNNLTKKLGLNDTQKKQVYDFSLASNQEIDQQRASKEKGDHKRIVQIRKDLDVKIESILTADQKTKLEAMRQKQLDKRKAKKEGKDEDDNN
ncbi:MAG: hypothetical protein EAZ85_09035 [Bacteroidetes bacterium]|nr:MAG: hypothetical protein EAZ85_09035 [Bacteroidota bacterium]